MVTIRAATFGHNVAWSQVFMVTKLHSHNKSHIMVRAQCCMVTITVTIVRGNVLCSQCCMVTLLRGHGDL